MSSEADRVRQAEWWREASSVPGWPGKVLAASVLLWLALNWLAPDSFFRTLLQFCCFVLGTWVGVRLLRRLLQKAIWRLRNRLYVAYLFIAVVPVALILILVQLSIWGFSGQIAVYLVYSELERRVTGLRNSAQALLGMPPAEQREAVGRISMLLKERYPGAEMIYAAGGKLLFPPDGKLAAPPSGWGETSGVVVRDGRLYIWAHARRDGNQATVLAPVQREFLADLAPDIGEVTLVSFESPGRTTRRVLRPHVVERSGDKAGGTDKAAVPPPVNMLDFDVLWGSRLPVAIWEEPGKTETWILGVHTRISPVLRSVFSQRMEWDQPFLLYGLYAVAILFLLVELISLVVGVSITRTITGAVHNLYEGTQRIKEGDFTHRIGVNGNDQLAELSVSFNQMTEHVERLLKVAKENERLQAELEIAREVQTQLYPRTVPELGTFQLKALCNPARMVSGDYYDYQMLGSNKVALAMGDVAGKGISAALLMATLASSLRTQLRHCLEAASSGNGVGSSLATANLMAQLNQHLYAHTSPEKYASLCFGVYDGDTHQFIYTNAGHPPPILIHNGEARRLEVNGIVVGAFPFAQYGESTVELEQGDLLVFFTDGISEPENEYGEMFGEERLADLLCRHYTEDINAIVTEIMGAVRQWTFSPDSADDMTLLLARRC